MSVPTRERTARAWLRRQPRRNLLVIALLPVLVWMWLPLLTGGSKASSPTSAAASPPASPADTELVPPGAPLAETAAPADLATPAAITRLGARVQHLRLPYQPRWQPTRESAMARRSAPHAGTSTRASGDETANRQLTPSLILLSPGQPPVAIVDGRPYRVGDTVLGHTVMTIAEQHMLYRSGNTTVTARLPAPHLGDRR